MWEIGSPQPNRAGCPRAALHGVTTNYLFREYIRISDWRAQYEVASSSATISEEPKKMIAKGEQQLKEVDFGRLRNLLRFLAWQTRQEHYRTELGEELRNSRS